MSRSGYTDDIDDELAAGRWRGRVASALRGKRGQAFLREMAAAMDAMPVKALIADELINAEGDCCAIGTVCKARGVDVSRIDFNDPEEVARAVDIAHPLAAEIEFQNDESGPWDHSETPQERWQRMRAWIERKIFENSPVTKP